MPKKWNGLWPRWITGTVVWTEYSWTMEENLSHFGIHRRTERSYLDHDEFISTILDLIKEAPRDQGLTFRELWNRLHHLRYIYSGHSTTLTQKRLRRLLGQAQDAGLITVRVEGERAVFLIAP